MNSSVRITTEQAIAILFEDAMSDPTRFQAKIAEAAKRNPNGLEALLKAAGVEMLGDKVVAVAAKSKHPLVIGEPIRGEVQFFVEFPLIDFMN